MKKKKAKELKEIDEKTEEEVRKPISSNSLSLSDILCEVGIPGFQEEPIDQDEAEGSTPEVSPIDQFPKQHECKPDYIKMFVCGTYLNEYENLFGEECQKLEGDMNEDLEVQFLDGDIVEELEIHMASTEEKEFFDEPFDVALDSGAGDHVTAEKDAPNYEIEPSKGSKMGQNFVTACKQKLANKGQVNLKLRSGQRARGKGTDIKTVFQIADVKRPLWSVSKI